MKAPLGPDGLPQVRLVQDYKPLNEFTPELYDFNQHKTPRISDVLDSSKGHTIFSGIDFSNAFNQILLKEDRCKTNFSSDMGNFQYISAPYGLRNMPLLFVLP